MNTAVILCAGNGTKCHPYTSVRNKVMIPISNRPILSYGVESLLSLGFRHIVLVTGAFCEEIRAFFRDVPQVEIVEDPSPKGTAFSAFCAKDRIEGDFLLLYGDTIADTDDLRALRDTFLANGENAALLDAIDNRSSEHIGCTVENGYVSDICGH